MLTPLLPWQVRLRLSALRGVEQARVALGKGGTVRVGPWIVLCQAETPRLSPVGDVVTHIDGGEQGLITAAVIAQVAASYDPRIHRAAIVATEEGNPHLYGEDQESAGWIQRVVATPTHLWGLVVEIVDEDGTSRMEKLVAGGRLHRSVYIGPRSDVQGGLYLRHLALSPGRPEGQGGNPLLSWYWPDALKLEAPGPRLEAFEPAGMFRLAYEPTGGTPPQEDTKMTAEDLQVIKDAIATALAGIETKMGETAEATKASVAEAVAPIEGRLAALETGLAETKTKIETGSKADVEKTMRLSLQSLAEQGRLAPAEVDAELAELLALPGELATKRLSRLAERKSIGASKLLVLPDKMKYAKAPLPQAERVSRTAVEIEAAAMEAGYITEASTPQEKIAAMDRIAREQKAAGGMNG